QKNSEDADRACNHAMAVLELDPSHHARHMETAERSGPVGHREAGVIAGHERARDDENKRAERNEGRITMKPGWVFCRLHARVSFQGPFIILRRPSVSVCRSLLLE